MSTIQKTQIYELITVTQLLENPALESLLANISRTDESTKGTSDLIVRMSQEALFGDVAPELSSLQHGISESEERAAIRSGCRVSVSCPLGFRQESETSCEQVECGLLLYSKSV